MDAQEIQNFLVKTIREEFQASGVQVLQIFLFGSRSRGEAGPHSDWDFLLCVKDELSFPFKSAIITKIQSKLAVHHISVDIIVKSEKALDDERDNVGVITYYALRDGVKV